MSMIEGLYRRTSQQQIEARLGNSVIFINRAYPPNAGATGQLLQELARALAAKEWQVTVITARPVATDDFGNKDGDVSLRQVHALPLTRASHWRRALSYLSLYPTLLWQGWRSPRADVIVTMTDPPLQAAIGPILKWTTGARLVHWAQDIYPELAERLGVLKQEGAPARILRAVSNWSLRNHDRIVVIGRCMAERLAERGVAVGDVPVEIIPNWADSSGVRPRRCQDSRFRSDHNLDGRFVIMYSGNLGLAHPFEAMLDAADILAEALPEAVLLFVGDGPRLSWVKRTVAERVLKNVRFLPFQPKERLSESLGAADLHLACMHTDLCGLVVPSKVYGILAAGRPCLFLGPADCEVARVIVDHRSGDVIEEPNGASLAASIVEWCRNTSRRDIAGKAARKAAEAQGVEQAAEAFAAVLETTARTLKNRRNPG